MPASENEPLWCLLNSKLHFLIIQYMTQAHLSVDHGLYMGYILPSPGEATGKQHG